ncbi:SDR family oxidoreductase [Streptomyces sp. NPDC056367]|uniref:SDR family oxidoreductase n=1 Tax=Streptomyces sp. NPDC056367 TaxID=3345797 RepID=UPI0035D8AA4D
MAAAASGPGSRCRRGHHRPRPAAREGRRVTGRDAGVPPRGRRPSSDHWCGRDGAGSNRLVVGTTHTELIQQVLEEIPELREPFVSRAAQKRMADPSEIAQAAAWFLSDRSSFVTGAAMPVDGGWTAK